MQLIEFVRQRAVEDAVLARASDPPDGNLLYSSRLADRLVHRCGGRQRGLTPRQHELMLLIADRYRGHGDYDPRWRDELPRRLGRLRHDDEE